LLSFQQSEELETYLRTVRYSSWSFTELVQCAPFQVVVRVKAVEGGVEPPRSDSISNKISRLCGQPILLIYFVLCIPVTRGYVFRAYAFHHPTIS
jgi:hypothetical protein